LLVDTSTSARKTADADIKFLLSEIGRTSRTKQIEMSRLRTITLLVVGTAIGCSRARNENTMLNPQQERATNGLRQAYAAFNRGNIDTAVRLLDPQVEWTEPAEFPGGGTYHGVEEAKRYLIQSRASATQVISEPERFIFAGDRIVVFVHARVLPKDSSTWQEIRLADVYTLEDGRVKQMRAFTKRADALRWVGIEEKE
jgi:ketosteroid isomerase-like protein